MKALWLASWYPTKLSPFNGDFIKRHAEAVALYAQVHVIHLARDEAGLVTKDVLVEENNKGNFSETIVYYHLPKRYGTWIDKLRSAARFRKMSRQAVLKYIQKNGEPDIVHVHVGMKAGLIASWIKRKWEIPFVITEHWSGFLSSASEKFEQLPRMLKFAWTQVVMQSSGCSAVSSVLNTAIRQRFPQLPCRVIPNVVNTDIFYPLPVHTGDPQFIHISGLDDLKNPFEILQAFKIVLEKYPAAKLQVFGSQRKKIVDHAFSLGLGDAVRFHPEVPQSTLAAAINRSDALILYSSYETFGCVIIEANACGVPVIVSDIPVFHETVTAGENGNFVPLKEPAQLAAAMIKTIENRSLIDKKAIAAKTGSLYSYEVVGKMFEDWYREVVKET